MRLSNSRISSLCVVVALVLSAAVPRNVLAQNSGYVKITKLPPATRGGPDAMYPIAGTVSGIASSDYGKHKIVIYAHAGGTWFVQPYDYAPKTGINSSGQFKTSTHGGDRYAVLLVKAEYDPPPTLPEPPEKGGDVVDQLVFDGAAK